MIDPKIPLLPHQIICKNWILSHPYCGLFLRMGLGKTAATLEALYELNPHGHVLIIAPKPVARCTWINEIRKWDLPFRTKSLIDNENGKPLTKRKRDALFDAIASDLPTVYFINRDLVTKLTARFPGNTWPFPIVVIDESQSFKSYNSARFKALQAVRPWIFRLIELTGSPQPKGLEDLWSQIWLLDMGQRLGPNITTYRQTYFRPGLIINNHPVKWEPLPWAKDVIYAAIRDLVLAMDNKFLTLPDITYNDVEVEMDEPEMERYRAFAKTFVLELKDGSEIEAVIAAVLHCFFNDTATAEIYTDTLTHTYEKIHEKKLEMCLHIIENTDGNVLIAYRFRSDLDMLLRYFKENEIDAVVFDGSPEMERNWNQKQYPVMLLQPASNSAGLNLQNGGSTLIWYTLSWNLEHYEQTNARIYRQGQTQPVIIHHLLTKHTIDRKTLRALQRKDLSQQSLFDVVSETLKTV